VRLKTVLPFDEADRSWDGDGPFGAVLSTSSRSAVRTRSPVAVGILSKGAPGPERKQTLYSPAGMEIAKYHVALVSVISTGDAAQPATTE